MDCNILINNMVVGLLTHLSYIEQNELQIDKLGITMNEINTLDAIKDVEPTTMGNVARKLFITLPTLTSAVNKLEKKGYVKRLRDPSDGRIVHLELSEKGLEIVNLHEDFRNGMINQFLEDLNEQEEEVLLKVLLKLQEVLEDYYKTNKGSI